ncbi:LacI family transcriptional regulator [Paenibacillus darwinianus]|uniref:LacI family transcriptional regulator n=1 Tax=Paenibacillus darwinianus TaxID=1380763 RepID=A0A9W5S3E7_9BACL|nr:LacI family DNA-binding transcriptional regulator [Paenibacillus darwinianus]EXX87115.1 LacI family transcriptional regulator [Paenibacillus darwinianus]EXX90550.1 LacI family transcriptional regulator [Paenibacillus darwinianus]EXX90597.1 LacI family transcriptional regulator [Paenibacillus darwinianus]
MATRKEVADMAGVSEATVSRVMNGVGPIRESTRQKVLEAAQTLNYHMNAIASSFARGRSGNLGVVIPHVPKVRLFSTYYFSEMMSGIGEAARAHGCGLLLLYRDPAVPYDYVSLFRTQRIDGCLVLGANSLPSETTGIAAMAEAGLPFCLIDQSFDDPGVSAVVAAHETGSYHAVSHLIESGFGRIGFLNGAPQYSTSADRLAGYRRALEESGIGFDPGLLYEGNYSMRSGQAAAAAVFADREKLDAVFVANDRMAIGLLQGLRERGCETPEDMRIVGYDDSDASRISDPPLTTVKVPFYEMGLTAADMLLERIPGWSAGASVFRRTMPTELVVRKSSAK